MPTQRAFHALSGTEVKEKLIQEVRKVLDSDTRFAGHLTFPVVTWKWSLNLEAYPNEPPEIRVGAGGKIHPSGERQAPPLVAKAIDISSAVAEQAPARASVLVDARGQRMVPRPEPSPAPTQSPGADAEPPAWANCLFSAVETISKRVASIEGNAMSAKASPGDLSDEARYHEEQYLARPTPIHHGQAARQTAGGEAIDGGAKLSPGAEAANSWRSGEGATSPVGGVIGTTVGVELELGVSHPPINEGGIGPPDAVRREAGLPIPTARNVPGVGIVDVPASSF